jgi:hypothetical protein
MWIVDLSVTYIHIEASTWITASLSSLNPERLPLPLEGLIFSPARSQDILQAPISLELLFTDLWRGWAQEPFTTINLQSTLQSSIWVYQSTSFEPSRGVDLGAFYFRTCLIWFGFLGWSYDFFVVEHKWNSINKTWLILDVTYETWRVACDIHIKFGTWTPQKIISSLNKVVFRPGWKSLET